MAFSAGIVLKGLFGAAAVLGTLGIVVRTYGVRHLMGDEQSNEIPEHLKFFLRYCEGKKYCDIPEKYIKKIKFEALGEGKEEEITITPYEVGKLKMKIEGKWDFNKYIFLNNSSEDIVISRGKEETKSVVLKANGKTRFQEENKELRPFVLGDYGLPRGCEKKPCRLSVDDLSLIRFSGFDEDGESNLEWEITSEENRESSIRIERKEEGKYVIKNVMAPVVITRGDKSVTLDGGVSMEFTVDEHSKLMKERLGKFGLPLPCELAENENSKRCSLSLNDLKKLKFKDMDDLIMNMSWRSGEIILNVQRTSERNYPGGKKYNFTIEGEGDNDFLIFSYGVVGTREIWIWRKSDNFFRENGDSLEQVGERYLRAPQYYPYNYPKRHRRRGK